MKRFVAVFSAVFISVLLVVPVFAVVLDNDSNYWYVFRDVTWTYSQY